MQPIRIVPRFRLILFYDIRAESHDSYFRFVTNDFVPALQHMGLYMLSVWHTAYGDYPIRQVEFVSEDLDTVLDTFRSQRFKDLELRLRQYTVNYTRKLVRYQDRFQF
jgi:hypothetical protein